MHNNTDTSYHFNNNMLYMPLIMTCMTCLTSVMAEFAKKLMEKLSEFMGDIWLTVKQKIPYLRKYTVTVTYDMENEYQTENNKLLIDAILFDFDKGIDYKIKNKKVGMFITDDEIKNEKSRNLILSVNNKFKDNDIYVEYTTKSASKNDDDKKVNYNIDTLVLTSNKSVEYIQEYMKRKRDHYIDKVLKNDDNVYIYTGSTYGQAWVDFEKKRFMSKKTFKTWFSSHKNKVLQTIDNFTNKKESFSLDSCTYKLGILLYGTPGCGKTSFIKSLAKHMNRHLIVISLNNFQNVNTFTKIFNSDYILTYENSHILKATHVPMDKRILVFEDIDTAGLIVMNRELMKRKIMNNDYDDSLSSIFDSVKEKYKSVSKENDKAIKKPTYKYDSSMLDKSFCHKSGLTLGDILNVLDGICEITGLVYVLTTNHKELLDPALIRPGRITCSFELKEMNCQELKEMLNYYYVSNNIHNDEKSGKDKKKVINIIAQNLANKMTPSKMEELCNTLNLTELLLFSKG